MAEYQVEHVLTKMKEVLEKDPQNTGLWEKFQMFAIEFNDRIPERKERTPMPTASMYCPYNGCEKFVAYKVRLIPEDEPLNWRAFNTFSVGHMLEMWVKSLLVEAGYTFKTHESSQLRWYLPEFKSRIYVGPDFTQFTDWYAREVLGYTPKHIIGEIKSASKDSFDRMLRRGIEQGAHSYYEQCQLGMAGTGADVCLFLAICKNTGRMLEVWIERDETEITELDNRFLTVHQHTPDELRRSIPTVPVTVYHRGKTPLDERDPDPRQDPDNVATERLNKNGHVIGYDERIGDCLHWKCGYCAYKFTCWGDHIIDTTYEDGGKPTYWVDMEVIVENPDDDDEPSQDDE